MSVDKYINPGIETLVEIGAVNRMAVVRGEPEKGGRNEILNCIGCVLERGENCVTGTEISNCSGLNDSFVSTSLIRLEKGGILASATVRDPDTLNNIRLFRIADNERGRMLLKTITSPPECGLGL